jgi:hypothetical protein
MQKVLWLLLLLVGFTGMSRAAITTAADNITPEPKEQTLFIFGVSQNLRDSVAYVTDIVAITASNLLQKKFFTDRDLYAEQLRVYVEQTFASPHQTAVVFYDKKIVKLEKMRQKLRVKLAGQKLGLDKIVVKDIFKDQFQFKKLEVAGSN